MDNKGIIDGLRKGESECMKPRAGDAGLWIQIWEELHGLAESDILVQFERFVTEGNEKADELAKSRSNAGRRFFCGRSKEQKLCNRKERRCMRHCSMLPAPTAWWNNGRMVKSSSPSRTKSGFLVNKKSEETKHRTEWCEEADKYRCVRCGRGKATF